MRTWLALTSVLLAACLTNRVGPGLLRQDWNQRPRDPDPRSSPTDGGRDPRWDGEQRERIPGPGEAQPASTTQTEGAGEAEDGPGVDLAKRSLATVLGVGLGGWLPLAESSGTFEEDPATRRLHRQRAQRAARARAAARKRRIERAP